MRARRAVITAFLPLLFFVAGHSLVAQTTLSSKADYLKYVDPLLTVKDFGTAYSADGAADATVLFPPDDKPRDAVLVLVRLGRRSIPLLIDCLSDQRVTTVRFRGSTVAKPINVPLGYVCLDILMGTTKSRAVNSQDCADDGLGACIEWEFYFLPHEYSECFADQCLARPWVGIVQRNWRRLFLQKRVRFENPYH
jgi:hypothetical protein